jgi:DNA (cytosine-5)-methyltransferase 1
MSQTFIDLFSGAGGMSCGLEMAGWQCLLAIDYDKAAIETFRLNHPTSETILGDIREISIDKIKQIVRDRQVDLICGGPPCQGFSTIGQNDSDDQRNFLFLEFIRIVNSFKPNYVVMENVTGILSKKNEKILKKIINCFEEIGYTVDLKVLSAHHYGVPERRRRTILLGNRFGIKNLYPEPLFQDSEKDSSELPPPRTVGWAFSNLIKEKGQVFNHDLERAKITNDLEKQRLSYIPEGKSIRYEKDQVSYLPSELWFSVDWSRLHESRFREAKLNRLDRNCCSNTINTSRTTYYHPTENRYLTAREAAAIQSFPPSYIFSGSLAQQWKQIGNAVPPLLAKSIGETIITLDKLKHCMDRTGSTGNIDAIRSQAFSYKNEMNRKKTIQLSLF